MKRSALFVSVAASFIALAALILLVYGVFIEPYSITVKHVVVKDSRLARAWGNIKIAQLSDLHITDPDKRQNRVRALLTALQPDIIVITGDIAQWNMDPSGAVSFIESLHAPLGVFCVMGDADFSSRRKHCLFCHPAGNVHVLRTHPALLRDEIRCVNLDQGREMMIAGVAPQGDWAGEHDFPQKLLETPGEPVLVLSHFSGRFNEIKPVRPVLWLSGDTHGGQIMMPDFFWKFVHKKPDPRHMAGLFHEGAHKWLYVNQGIGTTEHVPVRIGVPPEITIFSFSSDSPDSSEK